MKGLTVLAPLIPCEILSVIILLHIRRCEGKPVAAETKRGADGPCTCQSTVSQVRDYQM